MISRFLQSVRYSCWRAVVQLLDTVQFATTGHFSIGSHDRMECAQSSALLTRRVFHLLEQETLIIMRTAAENPSVVEVVSRPFSNSRTRTKFHASTDMHNAFTRRPVAKVRILEQGSNNASRFCAAARLRTEENYFTATIYAIQLAVLGAFFTRAHSPVSSPFSSSCSQ